MIILDTHSNNFNARAPRYPARSFEAFREHVRGLVQDWTPILSAAGIDADFLDSRREGPCPKCSAGSTKSTRFRMFADERGGCYCSHCFSRRNGDGFATVAWYRGCSHFDAVNFVARQMGVDEFGRWSKPGGCTITIPLSKSPPIESSPATMAPALAAPTTPATDFAALAARCYTGLPDHVRRHLADSLRLSAKSLERLRVGWLAKSNAWTFPMLDAAGNVVGIRLRSENGKSKFSVRGGKNGLFTPVDLFDLPFIERLFVTEGATDAASILDLGFTAVGRPDAQSGVQHVVDLVRRLRPPEVVVIADRDAHGVGSKGAERLAADLLAVCRSVRVIMPPDGFKDAREWKQSGATAADVLSLVDASPVRRLRIKIAGKR